MGWFDHVRCNSCKVMLDPESLRDGMRCPSCGEALALTDLFGVSAAFSEEEEAPVSFDDLVPSSPVPSSAAGPAPSARPPTPAEPGTALAAMRAMSKKKKS